MRLAHAFLAVLAISTTVRGLDLTPIETTRDLEGFKIPVIHFNDGPTRYARWQPPKGWQHSYDGSILTLRPKDAEQAQLQFRILGKKAEEPAITPEGYAKYAAALLPASFMEPVAGPTLPSPFTLGVITTTEFTFTAREFARPIKVSIFLADLDDTHRFAITLVSREADFTKLREAVVTSLVGWSWEQRSTDAK